MIIDITDNVPILCLTPENDSDMVKIVNIRDKLLPMNIKVYFNTDFRCYEITIHKESIK